MPFFICHCHSTTSQRHSLHLLVLSPPPPCCHSSNSQSSPLFAFRLLLSAACPSFGHIREPLPVPQSSLNVPVLCHNTPSMSDCAKIQERLYPSLSFLFFVFRHDWSTPRNGISRTELRYSLPHFQGSSVTDTPLLQHL